jgi:hypothetical protein
VCVYSTDHDILAILGMDVIESTRQWVETVVIELNLCPFAKRELLNNRVRFYASEASTPEQLLIHLKAELERLERDPSIETTLLIHPHTLLDFFDYNQFLDVCDALLIDMKLQGIYQIASFHPHYCFIDTHADDVENYTNRSPFSMLHLIREQSLERALANYPDADKIPERNIVLLKSLGREKMRALLQACL